MQRSRQLVRKQVGGDVDAQTETFIPMHANSRSVYMQLLKDAVRGFFKACYLHMYSHYSMQSKHKQQSSFREKNQCLLFITQLPI